MGYIKGLVSIMVPCFNGEKHLSKFLDSVLAQSYRNIQLVIVNDGSKDNSEKIILSYKDLFDKKGIIFEYYLKENSGIGIAINFALKKIKGEYFTWYNCDDILTNCAIEKMVSFLTNNEEYHLVKSDYYLSTEEKPFVAIGRGDDGNPDKGKEDLFINLVKMDNVNYSATMVRSGSFYIANTGFDIYPSREGQNLQILIPMLYKYKKTAYIDEPLYYVIEHNDSTSRRAYYDIRKKVAQQSEYRNIVVNTLKSLRCMSKEEKRKYIAINTEKISRYILFHATRNHLHDYVKNERRVLKKIHKWTKEDSKWFREYSRTKEYRTYLIKKILGRNVEKN